MCLGVWGWSLALYIHSYHNHHTHAWVSRPLRLGATSSASTKETCVVHTSTAPQNETGLLSTDDLWNLVHHHDQSWGHSFLPCMGSYHPYLNPFRLLAYFSIHHSLHLFPGTSTYFPSFLPFAFLLSIPQPSSLLPSRLFIYLFIFANRTRRRAGPKTFPSSRDT